jgi:hypothetical protein
MNEQTENPKEGFEHENKRKMLSRGRPTSRRSH